MKSFLKRITALSLTVIISAGLYMPQTFADNPVVQTIYTADGAPMVYNDTFYLYTGHDEDNADYFTMNEWRCYSSTDMKNWTDLGSPLTYETFKWSSGEAWASQCIERDGKFYFYSTVTSASGGGRAIGVAVADNPEGPFTDPIGKPLAGPNWSYIDPTVFIDDDGQAYLYWGNGGLWYVKLNDDMISYSGSPIQVDVKSGAFGAMFTEAPYLYKHGDWYYMVYAADGIPENISYSMSKSPTGPWTFKGVIMDHGGNSFTNHPGIIDYKGKSYFTYHTGTLEGGGGFARSMCIEEFEYNSDGTIPKLQRTKEGCKQLEGLNPYQRTEAETICCESGMETEKCSTGGLNVCDVQNGEYIKVAGADFGEGAKSFEISVASATNGGTLELHLDSVTGTKIGSISIAKTGAWQTWETVSCDISGAVGTHDLYFTFAGSDWALFNMDWWQFYGSSALPSFNRSLGDVDGDGLVNAVDLSFAKRGVLIGFEDKVAKTAADVNQDSKVDEADILLLAQFIHCMITEFPKAEIVIEKKPTTVANPVIWADVPDMDYVRVDDTYYMISTTMYFNPGAPIMKSKDLVSWEICSYVYDTLENNDTTNLLNGKSCYGNGSWAASIRYKNGCFYVFFASNDQGKSYIFQTTDIESGKWEKYTINGLYHDASLFFDDDGKNYLIYGSGTINIKQLNSAVTGFEPNGVSKQLFKCDWEGIGEGSHFYKIDGYYYDFIIGKWPRSEMCFRSSSLLGNYECKTVLCAGVGTYGAGCAQGGIIDTSDGKWYSLQFQDHGAVGRIPSLIPVIWKDHWPEMGVNGVIPTSLSITTDYKGTNLVTSDEFNSGSNELALEWQWNHNPDNTKWSLTENPGYLRLKTGAVASDLLRARNSLTQRTEGPACTSVIKMNAANMKTGDYAGLAAFQELYGQVGVYVNAGGEKKLFVAENAIGNNGGGIGCSGGQTKITAEAPLTFDTVYLKIDFLFSTFDAAKMTSSSDIDKASFYYSYDGSNWMKLGNDLQMKYKLTLFTGYRTAIFNYATKAAGGYVDIDYFHYSKTKYQPAL